MKRKLLAVLGCALLSGAANAGGFQVNLQGQKQIGMGHTGTGLAMDEASIFFNPGAMSHLRENGFQLGVSGIMARTAYANPETGYTTETEHHIITPFQAYGVFGAKEGKLKAGLGVYTPFGSTVEYPDGWAGQFVLNEISLRAIYIQPTISYAITDKIGIGAGFVYALGSVNLQKSIPVQGKDGQYGLAELDGNGNGIGYNAGIYFKPSDKFSLGVSYRSEVKMKVDDGDADFTTVSSQPVSSKFPDTKFKAELPLPGTLSIGLGFMPTEKLTIAADANFVQWSSYENLQFDYDAEINGSKSTISPRNYENSYAIRLGGQYATTDALTLRAGAYFDKTPVQAGYLSAETPDSDRIGLSAGLSYKFSDNFNLDLSFLYINGKERTQTAEDISSAGTQADVIAGKFKTQVYIPGIGISYKF